MLRSILFSASVAVMLLTAAASGQTTQAWQKFTSAEGRFEVAFPAKPTTDVRTIATATSPAVMTSFSANSDGGEFLAAYTDYKADITDPLAALERSEKGSLDAVRGTLISSSATTFMGYPARVFKMKVDPLPGVSLFASTKYILVGRRLYQVVVVRTVDSAAAPENEKFISSFRFVTTPANVAQR